MATASRATHPADAAAVGERRMVLHGISWKTYEALAADLDDQAIRLAYDRGALELMSPLPPHERYKKLLGCFVEAALTGLGIPFEPAGSARWSREASERGLEPDECYFLAPEKLAIVAGRAADRPGDPTPDLAIEIDISRPEVDRMAIYASLDIPEVWRFDEEQLRIDRLRGDGTYEDSAESRFLPIRAEEVLRWLRQAGTSDFPTWMERVRDWIRNEVVPRRRVD